ncbi:MAG: hypothetical protein AB8G22_19755 [Saprospiraceae bacterium]
MNKNLLELKNDLHRLIVETEDAQLLQTVKNVFASIKQPFNAKKASQRKEENIPRKPDFLSDAFIYEKGRWVYAGSLPSEININEIILEERRGREPIIMQNL